MFCNACGKPIPEGAANCPECGAPTVQITEAVPTVQPVAAETPAPAMSFKEFLKLPENKKLKSSITTNSIILYFCSALSVVLAFVMPEMGSAVFDAVLLAVLALWLHISKSRVPAVIILIYAVINTAFMLINNGTLGGWIILLAGIYSVINTFRARKEYKNAVSGK